MAQRSHTHLLDKADKGVGELGRTGPQEGQVSRIPQLPAKAVTPAGTKQNRGGAEAGPSQEGQEPIGGGTRKIWGRDQIGDGV